MTEICHRLDGIPLAIELAASRVRALALTEIVDSLHDRFRLLTGGSRIAVRRQQTMRASVDWSHALLTGPEQVLFRRLAVFPSGFDLDGAQAAAAGGDVQRYEVVDLLSLLADKSLVVTDDSDGRTRYRLLETVRQYALEKLRESGDADAVRARHRDHYAAVAAGLDAPRWPAMNAGSTRPSSRSTTYGPLSRSAARMAIPATRCCWHHVCSRCGVPGAACKRAGLVRRRPGRPRCTSGGGRPWVVCAGTGRPGPDRCRGRHHRPPR